MTATAKRVEHAHVRQEAFDINHPSVKLVNMIGGGFFNEPRHYYNDSTNFEAFSMAIKESGTVHPLTLKSLGLTEQACEVIEAAVNVANSEHPEDLLIIAYWARDLKKGLKMRTTPQILLAIAAAHPNTKPFVRKYTPAITQRADDIGQVFGAFRSLFQPVKMEDGTIRHKGTVPHSLRKGLADAIRQTPAFGLIRYKNQSPSLKDVLKMIGGSKHVKNAVSPGMYDYLVKDQITDRAPAILKTREIFNKTPNTPEGLASIDVTVLIQGGITWENLISKFGSTKQSWEAIIPTMGEMALTRNLRNFEDVKISPEHWNLVVDKLTKAAQKSVQMPYQYFTAAKYVNDVGAKAALEIALDKACESLPELPGVSLILSDNSGSASQANISEKSDTTVSDCGNTLMAVMAKKFGPARAILGVFGDRFRQVQFTKEMTCMNIAGLVKHYASEGDIKDGYIGHERLLNPSQNAFKIMPSSFKGVGPGTETGLWYALEDLIDQRIMVQRIILMSDNCCYNLGDINSHGLQMESKFDKYKQVNLGNQVAMSTMINYYLQEVNPDCHVYSVNLAGHSQAQVSPGSHVHLLSGWSERLVNTMLQTETPKDEPVSVTPQVVEQQRIPTLDAIRKDFSLGV